MGFVKLHVFIFHMLYKWGLICVQMMMIKEQHFYPSSLLVFLGASKNFPSSITHPTAVYNKLTCKSNDDQAWITQEFDKDISQEKYKDVA